MIKIITIPALKVYCSVLLLDVEEGVGSALSLGCRKRRSPRSTKVPLASEKRLGSDSDLPEELKDNLLQDRDNVQVLRDGSDVQPLI